MQLSKTDALEDESFSVIQENASFWKLWLQKSASETLEKPSLV